MKSLAIYDPRTGEVFNLILGRETIIEGVPSVVVEIPEGYRLETLDVSSGTPYPILKPYSDTPYYQIQAQADRQADALSSITSEVESQNEILNTFEVQSSLHENELSEMQLALAEIYELLTARTEAQNG